MQLNYSNNRVTVLFNSDSENEYLYDDVTGSIFPWNSLREESLKSYLLSKNTKSIIKLPSSDYSQNEIDATINFIKHWIDNYGAFVRNRDVTDFIAPSSEQLEGHVRNSTMQLVLNVTEDCNMRCEYCVFSKKYPNYRKQSKRKMDERTAIYAIDWYVDFIKPQLIRNANRRFALNFYGGEPLTNIDVIKRVLLYCDKKYPELFFPMITVNGTLLTEENVKILIDHGVQIALSIDGPKAEHDRLRKNAFGKGTFDLICKNLLKIKCDHPKYWRKNMFCVSVYDWKTDFDSVIEFFSRNEDFIPHPLFAMPVMNRNTDYYNSFSKDDVSLFLERIKRLKKKYKQEASEGIKSNSYLNALIGIRTKMPFYRMRIKDKRPSFLPFTSTCVPGEKMAIQVDGKIDICERVNGKYPIGHLFKGGIDYLRIKEIISSYQAKVLSRCTQCSVSKLCPICFSFAEGDEDFCDPIKVCEEQRNSARELLTDYVSIREHSEEIDLAYNTASYLERKMLLF